MTKRIIITLALAVTIILRTSASVQQGSVNDDPVLHFMDGSPKAVYPTPGQMTGSGVLPATVENCTYLGNQTTVSGPIYRDVGFTGVLNNFVIWVYADTLWKRNPLRDNYTFWASSTVAFGRIDNLTAVYDFNITPTGTNRPRQFVPILPDEKGKGTMGAIASNVIEIGPNRGLIWYTVNNRTHNGGSIKTGVATITADLEKGVVLNRTIDHMWEPHALGEPRWGDKGVVHNPQDGYIYLFGGGFNSASYLARVKAAEALDVNAYTYWDNHTQTWNETRFGDGTNGTANYTTKQAIWGWNANWGSNPFWSNYYNTWMTVYGTSFSSSQVMYRTAPNLWGPWTEGKMACVSCLPDVSCTGMRYAVLAHPEYDITGKTLLVSWSYNNIQRLVKITWE